MKYKLKKEAVPFFKESLASCVYHFDTWQSLSVDMNALEEVKPLHVTYGHEKGNSSSLSGWANPETNKDGGAHFCFTLHFPSMEHQEYDKFCKGRVMRELMEKMQSNLNYFYEHFDFKNKV